MNFKEWFMEAVVNTTDLANAITKTLEFKIPGKWSFDTSDNHQWHPHKAIRVHGLLKNEKTPLPSQHFMVGVFAILEKPIESYDSIKGDSDMRIVAVCHYIQKPGHIRKLGERSKDIYPRSGYWGNHDGESLRTPYELANWIEAVINGFGNNDDGDDDDDTPEYTPSPTPSALVGVGV